MGARYLVFLGKLLQSGKSFVPLPKMTHILSPFRSSAIEPACLELRLVVHGARGPHIHYSGHASTQQWLTGQHKCKSLRFYHCVHLSSCRTARSWFDSTKKMSHCRLA